MMEIVMPLGIERKATCGAGIDYPDIVEIALCDDPSLTPQEPCLSVEGFGEFVEDVMGTEVVNAMNGIQANGVDVIFGEPVKSIVNKETPYAVALRSVEVQGCSPGRLVGTGETRGEIRQVTSFRPKVVVDDIQYNRQS